jgi:uncharacterized membrane protein
MERSTHQKILRLTGVAVFAALSFVLTRFAAIPYAGGAGYFNFGDVVTFFVAMAYGPVEGALVGIIGGTMSDLTAGYAAFAPWTLMAKGVMGLLTGLLYIVLKNHKIIRFVSPFIGAIAMILIYLGSYIVIYGYGALLGSAFDCLQGFGCAGLAIPLYLAVAKTGLFKRLEQ